MFVTHFWRGVQALCALALLAIVATTGALWVAETVGPADLATTPRGGPSVRRMSVADDGQSVWVTRFPDYWQQVDLATGRVLAAGQIPDAGPYGLQVSRCGSYFAYGNNRLDVHVIRRATADGPDRQMLYWPGGLPNRMELGSNGWLAMQDKGHLALWNVYEPDQLQKEIAVSDRLGVLLWSPDGSRLLVGESDRLALRDGRTLELLSSAAVPNSTIASFSADGRWIAACGLHGRIAVWDTTQDDAGVRWLEGNFRSAVALSPDGSRLTICDHHGAVWQLTTTDPVDREWLLQLPAQANALSYVPDGGRILVGLLNGDLLCWSFTEQRIVWRVAAVESLTADEGTTIGALTHPSLPPFVSVRG